MKGGQGSVCYKDNGEQRLPLRSGRQASTLSSPKVPIGICVDVFGFLF